VKEHSLLGSWHWEIGLDGIRGCRNEEVVVVVGCRGEVGVRGRELVGLIEFWVLIMGIGLLGLVEVWFGWVFVAGIFGFELRRCYQLLDCGHSYEMEFVVVFFQQFQVSEVEVEW
jgi:hypothetical protein